MRVELPRWQWIEQSKATSPAVRSGRQRNQRKGVVDAQRLATGVCRERNVTAVRALRKQGAKSVDSFGLLLGLRASVSERSARVGCGILLWLAVAGLAREISGLRHGRLGSAPGLSRSRTLRNVRACKAFGVRFALAPHVPSLGVTEHTARGSDCEWELPNASHQRVFDFEQSRDAVAEAAYGVVNFLRQDVIGKTCGARQRPVQALDRVNKRVECDDSGL
eukprot:6186022-Pleurochrysis_carterae.AAC.1